MSHHHHHHMMPPQHHHHHHHHRDFYARPYYRPLFFAGPRFYGGPRFYRRSHFGLFAPLLIGLILIVVFSKSIFLLIGIVSLIAVAFSLWRVVTRSQRNGGPGGPYNVNMGPSWQQSQNAYYQQPAQPPYPNAVYQQGYQPSQPYYQQGGQMSGYDQPQAQYPDQTPPMAY